MSPPNSILAFNHNNPQNHYMIEGQECPLQTLLGDSLVSLGENIAMLRFEQLQLKNEKSGLEEGIRHLKVVHLNEWKYVICQARANMFSICDRMRTISMRLIASREQAEQSSPASESAKKIKDELTTIDANMWIHWANNLSKIDYETEYVDYQPTEDKPTPKLTLKFLPAQIQSAVHKLAKTHWERYVKLELETTMMRSETQSFAKHKDEMIRHHSDKIRTFKRSIADFHYNKIIEELTTYENQLKSLNPSLTHSYFQEKIYFPEKVIVLELLVPLVYFIKQRKEEFSA